MSSLHRSLLEFIAKETIGLIKVEMTASGIVKRTGTLDKSFDYTIVQSPKGIRFEMVYYGEFLDSGTRYIEPREFFRPVIDRQIQKYIPQIASAIVRDALNNTPF